MGNGYIRFINHKSNIHYASKAHNSRSNTESPCIISFTLTDNNSCRRIRGRTYDVMTHKVVQNLSLCQLKSFAPLWQDPSQATTDIYIWRAMYPKVIFFLCLPFAIDLLLNPGSMRSRPPPCPYPGRRNICPNYSCRYQGLNFNMLASELRDVELRRTLRRTIAGRSSGCS